jgi:hypothetical protein
MASSSSLPTHIRAITKLPSEDDIQAEITAHLDAEFADLDVLLGRTNAIGGPSSVAGAHKRGRKRKTLKDEMGAWETRETEAAREVSVQNVIALSATVSAPSQADSIGRYGYRSPVQAPVVIADVQLESTSAQLPQLLEQTRTRLQSFLSSAQTLSLERYSLADRLANLVNELNADAPPISELTKGGYGGTTSGRTVLEQMEGLQYELQRLEAGLAWVGVLEQVLVLRYVPNPNR